MKTNVFNLLQKQWMQMSQDQFCNALGLVKGSDRANSLYRCFTFIGSNISGPGRENLISPEMLARIVGGTSDFVVVDNPTNLSELRAGITTLMTFANSERQRERSEYARNMALIYTHLEDALLRLNEVIKNK